MPRDAEAVSAEKTAPQETAAIPDLSIIKQETIHEEIEIEIDYVNIKNELEPSDDTQSESPVGGMENDMPQQGVAVSVKQEDVTMQLPLLRALLTSPKAITACYIESQNTLKKQKSSFKPPIADKILKCKLCQFTCARRNQLNVHLLKHRAKKDYKCDICSKAFSMNSNLQRHYRMHTGEKPYICGICDFTCAYSNILKTHMRRHTGERPYTCNQCDYSSAHSSAFREHYRVHTGEKPYKCDQCEYKSGKKAGLNNHLKTHSGVKPFKCNLCEYKSIAKAKLQRHQKTHARDTRSN